MGKLRHHEPVKLISGIIFSQSEFFIKAKNELINRYGEVDFESISFPFKYTDYYQAEMGKILWRKFISFKLLINPEKIVSIKLFTNKLEEKFFFPNSLRRRVNIDPGYLVLSKLILATTKNFIHRVYLGKGIYAEITLRYFKGKGFQPGEWTYPDYKSREYLEVFSFVRSIYQGQLEELEGFKGEK